MYLLAPVASASGAAAKLGLVQKIFGEHYLAKWGAPSEWGRAQGRVGAAAELQCSRGEWETWRDTRPHPLPGQPAGLLLLAPTWRPQLPTDPLTIFSLSLPCSAAGHLFQPGFALAARLTNFAYKVGGRQAGRPAAAAPYQALPSPL